MRDFFKKLMTDEESGHEFTTKEVVVYGIVLPAVLTVSLIPVIIFVRWIKTMCV